MPTNYLEQLVAEWYEYQGYFVRQNVLVGPRKNGGYEGELDIVAFHPVKRDLVHVEPSMDADNWETRERRFAKKFETGKKYIPNLFEGLQILTDVEQIAVLVFASTAVHKEVGGGKIVMIESLLKEIFHELKDKHINAQAIPEHLTILRSFQFVSDYRKGIGEVWGSKV